MTEIITLAPHDAIPTGPARRVVVLHRMDEDQPRTTVVTITLTGERDESTRPMGLDGQPMGVDAAIEAAQEIARSEGLDQVYVIDRTKGTREHDIPQHDGDHTVGMETLVDTDMEDGERGPDMRDRA